LLKAHRQTFHGNGDFHTIANPHLAVILRSDSCDEGSHPWLRARIKTTKTRST
jgi:hypothetical protein